MKPKTIAPCALVLLLFVSGNILIAQSQSAAPAQSPTNVRWNVRWQEGSQGSDKLLSDGAVVKILTANGVTVSASLKDTGWKQRADIMITNNSEQRFDVIPETFTLDVVTPKRKSLAYQAPEKLAKSLNRRAQWAAALSAFGGSLATQQSRSTSSTEGTVHATDNSGNSASGTYSGTTTTTTTSPDYFARQRANEQGNNALRNAGDTIDYIYKVSLKPNTVMPGKDVFGAVYFERDSKAETAILKIPVGDLIFEFPLGRVEEVPQAITSRTESQEQNKQSTKLPAEPQFSTRAPMPSADDYNQEGMKLYSLNKFAQAERAFREAVKIDAYNALYHHNLGTAINAQQRYEEAEREIDLAVRLAPNVEAYRKSLETVRSNRRH